MVNMSDVVSRIIEQSKRRLVLAEAVPIILTFAGVALLARGMALLLRPEAADAIGFWSTLASAVAAVTIVLVRLTMMQSLHVAQRLDRRLQLSETLSTAYELRDRPAGPVMRTLRSRADALAAQVDLHRVVPWWSRAAMFALGFLLVAALVVLAGMLRPSPQVAVDIPAGIEATDEEQVTSEGLDTLAQLLADDADRKNSDYLAAVSHSVERLAEQLQSGRSLEDVAAELKTLLEHAKAGYEGQLPSWLHGNSDDLQNMLQDAASFSEAKRQATLSREAQRDGSTEAGGLSSDMYNLDPSILERSAADLPAGVNPNQSKAGGEREGNLDNGPMGGSDFQPRPMDSEELDNAGALPIGGAAQSGKGESNIAGGGSQPLLDDAGFLQSMPDPASEMALTAADPQDDGHIRIYVPTSAEARDASGAVGGAEAYARQAAQAVDRQAVEGDAALVVSRYFNNAAGAGPGGPP